MNRSTLLLIFAILFLNDSCRTRYLPTYHPIISVDSLFINQAPSKIDNVNAIRLTNAVAMINEKYQQLLGYSFVRNYQLLRKKHSDFVIKGRIGYDYTDIGFGRSPQKDYYFVYTYTDKKSNKIYGDYGVLRSKRIDTGLRYDSISKDTDFKAFTWDLNTGFLSAFVPSNKILKPNNSDSLHLKSFAIDHYIQAERGIDDRVAKTITNLINNMLAYTNARNKGPRHTRALSAYNYYSNYLKKAEDQVKADFTIGGRLVKMDNGNYKLILEYKGDNLNLVTPERIINEVEFAAEDVAKGDYSTFLLSSTSKIQAFVLQQLLF